MRFAIVFVILVLATSVAALDLGVFAVAKPAASHQPPAPDPAVVALGGDTEADPIVLASFPILFTGSTVGYHDRFTADARLDGTGSPDVVYALVPDGNVIVDIDLRDSEYDTRVSVFRENLTLVATNDDFYPDYTSRLEGVVLVDGMTYYLVVDGCDGAAGTFQLAIAYESPCRLTCPDGVELEGEPALTDGYADAHNGACDAPQTIEGWLFHGRSGWFAGADGRAGRDTDWLVMEMPESGVLTIWGDAERPTYLAAVGAPDCGGAVLESVVVGPCTPGTLAITGEPGSTVALWVAPMSFVRPRHGDAEYSYILTHEDFLAPMSTSVQSWVRAREMLR